MRLLLEANHIKIIVDEDHHRIHHRSKKDHHRKQNWESFSLGETAAL